MPELGLGDREKPFAPGDVVAVIEVMRGKIWTVRPVTVVKDTPDEIALWLAPGTITRYPTGPQHGVHTVQHWITQDWELIDREWSSPGTLRLSRPGDAFEVWVAPGEGSPWYVNLQEPLRRVQAGFTTMDHVLDILVARDLTSWHWKDEEEFGYAQRTGLYSPARAAEIRETGLAVIEAVEAGQPPWDPSWAAWSPPLPIEPSRNPTIRRPHVHAAEEVPDGGGDLA